MPDPNELQLELGLDNSKAIAEATELHDYLEKMTKDIVDMFGEASAKLETYSEGFGIMRKEAESNMEQTKKDVGNASKKVKEHGEEQKKTGKAGQLAGKAMKVAWTDAKAGAATALGALKGIAGMSSLAGGVGAAGGLVAMFFGSWLTIDKINTAVKKTLIVAEGLRGEFGLMSGKMEGEYAKSFDNYKKRIEALDSAYEMGTDKAAKLVGSYTTVGHAVEDLNEDTLILAAGWDYLLGQPTGTWLTQRAQEAGTFGDKMEEAAMAATELYIQFGAFTKEGRKSAITVTDMQASMETASRTMAGWNSDFRSMSKFQQAFIEGSEEAGRTSKGAAESFGGLVGEVGNLDMQQMLALSTVFKEVGAGKGVVGAVGELARTKGYGEGPVGEAFAMQRFMKEGPEGMQGEFLYTMVDAMVTMSERMTGGGAMAIKMLVDMFGMSLDRATETVNGIDKMREAYTEEQPLSTKMTEEMQKDLEKGMQRARADALTMPEKIQAGIGLWWREVAPALFSTIVNGFGLIYDSIVWLSTFMWGGDKTERKVAAERIGIRGERIAENAKILEEATKKLVKEVVTEVKGSFEESLGVRKALPEYGAEKERRLAREAELAQRATEGPLSPEELKKQGVLGGKEGGREEGTQGGEVTVENLPDGGLKIATRDIHISGDAMKTSWNFLKGMSNIQTQYGG